VAPRLGLPGIPNATPTPTTRNRRSRSSLRWGAERIRAATICCGVAALPVPKAMSSPAASRADRGPDERSWASRASPPAEEEPKNPRRTISAEWRTAMRWVVRVWRSGGTPCVARTSAIRHRVALASLLRLCCVGSKVAPLQPVAAVAGPEKARRRRPTAAAQRPRIWVGSLQVRGRNSVKGHGVGPLLGC